MSIAPSALKISTELCKFVKYIGSGVEGVEEGEEGSVNSVMSGDNANKYSACMREKYFSPSHTADVEREFWRDLSNDRSDTTNVGVFDILDAEFDIEMQVKEENRMEALVMKDIWNIRHMQNPPEDLQIYVVSKNGNMLPFLPNPTTVPVYVAAINKTYQAYMYVPANLKYNLEILRAYFKCAGRKSTSLVLTQTLMAHILMQSYQENELRELLMCAVKSDGMCIRNIPKHLVTREMKMIAIRQSDGYAIQGIINPSDDLILFASSIMPRDCPVRKAYRMALDWNHVGRGSKDRVTGHRLAAPIGFKAFLLKKADVNVNGNSDESSARLYGYGGYEFPSDTMKKQPVKYEENCGHIGIETNGFHFCLSPIDVEKYRMHGHNGTVYAMISILGDVVYSQKVGVTNQFRIKKFLTMDELRKLQQEYK